jgi:hypothetical protein
MRATCTIQHLRKQTQYTYPSGFGLGVGIFLACVSLETIRGRERDLLLICDEIK